ncbi:MAG: hypothetical protein R3E12_19580 [Candidatus Eisenbacteria bacterium]
MQRIRSAGRAGCRALCALHPLHPFLRRGHRHRQLYIVNRGNRSEITTYPSKPLDNDYSLNTVDVCPVGAQRAVPVPEAGLALALHSRSAPGAPAAAYLEEDEETSTAIARGRTWRSIGIGCAMPGVRLSCRSTKSPGSGDEPGTGPAVLHGDHALTEILRSVQGRARSGDPLRGHRSTYFAVVVFREKITGRRPQPALSTASPAVEDEILRKKDGNPNSTRVKLLGLDRDPRADLARGGSLLVVVDDDPLGQDPDLAPEFNGSPRSSISGPTRT